MTDQTLYQMDGLTLGAGDLVYVSRADGSDDGNASLSALSLIVGGVIGGNYAPASHGHPWSAITSTPTTLAGYGITDALTQTTADARYLRITASSPTTSFTTSSSANCYYVDTSGGAITVTLNASPATNEVAEVWDATGHAAANPISFNGNGKTIAGSATLSNFIAINYGHARLIYTGTQWLMQ